MGCSPSLPARGLPERRFQDSYKFGRKLGEGTFGQVRLAEPTNGGAQVAVKIIDARALTGGGNLSRSADRCRVEQTRAEIAIWEAIGASEHCVTLKETFFDEPYFFIVMERCECSLVDKLVRINDMMESELIRIFSEMLRALAHVHGRSICHRDVKPDNFLLGGPIGNVVKLCDFGLAVRVPKARKGGQLKGVHGTPPYMSPEMLAGVGYGTPTDMWSLGATFYLMVYGEFPYMPAEFSAKGYREAILSGKPEIQFLRQGQGFFSEELTQCAEPLLEALLQRDAAARINARDALELAFFSRDHPDDMCRAATATSLATVADLARDATKDARRPANPIVQRNIDELLERLPMRLRAFSTVSEAMSLEAECISGRTQSEVRIRPSGRRHSTHSGVLTLQEKADVETLATRASSKASADASISTRSISNASSSSCASRSPSGTRLRQHPWDMEFN